MALKDRRDATIHLKSHDQYPSGGELDETSVFYRFLNDEIREFPRTAVAMVWFFRVAGESVPRWLNHPVKTVLPQRKKKDRNSCAWVPAAAWPLSQHGVWIANRGSGFCPESVLY